MFQEMREELDKVEVPGTATAEDSVHRVLVHNRQTKFKTLRQIRQGTTKRRVDQFENL